MPIPIQEPPRRIPPHIPCSPFSQPAAVGVPDRIAAPVPPRAAPPPAAAPTAPTARPGWQRVLTAVCAATLEGLGQCMEQQGEQMQAQSAQMAAPPAAKRKRGCCFGRRE